MAALTSQNFPRRGIPLSRQILLIALPYRNFEGRQLGVSYEMAALTPQKPLKGS